MSEQDHVAHFEAWVARFPRDLSSADRVARFDRAFSALRRRAAITLGKITAAAIVNRVVFTARDRYPRLAALKVDPGGVSLKGLDADEGALGSPDRAAALTFLPLEFLRLVGDLTGEILTPELHAEFARVDPRE